ncbi:hypothetical protein A2961_03100 [Candidatus Woesebacteria bacterium RIFCSPLOWO2_01_FULL_39_21]|uniref:Uncharacterized protein n=1 Tax=Candidatus Woesebacteria bacterium RIFCSPLOWO2_01_FULL_39_21 TaxID=1802519 RepID=A0A1F8BJA1_9BACT|nr:MAG: hypothetical protein A2691_02550 [Candidatus Woesebacteria bacterium RIFCSPHIGHO2_01_FULL_39_23]OGM63425.1 MAG: hypothetical protein A2961_03100 [Candidatus Woesebacteria bacterium RIFCSPLOWO2_01_FULL_39_21]
MDPKITSPSDQNQNGADFMAPPPLPQSNPTQPADKTLSQSQGTVTPLSKPNIPIEESPPLIDNHTVIAEGSGSTSGGRSRSSSGRIIATILGIALLVLGVGAGVVLVRQPTQFRTSAWDCEKYNFRVSQDGVVTVKNDSSMDEPLQKAKVFINSVEVATFDVPNLKSDEESTLGNVSVPDNGFSWQVIGSKDCSDSGTYGPKETPKPPKYETRIDCSGAFIKNTSDDDDDDNNNDNDDNDNHKISGIFEQFDPYFKKEFSLGPGESASQNWQGDLTPNVTLMYIDVSGQGRIKGEHYPSNCGTPSPTPTSTPNLSCPSGTELLFSNLGQQLRVGGTVAQGGTISSQQGSCTVISKNGVLLAQYCKKITVDFPSSVLLDTALIFDNDPKSGEQPWSINGISLTVTGGNKWASQKLDKTATQMIFDNGGDSSNFNVCVKKQEATPTPTATPITCINAQCVDIKAYSVTGSVTDPSNWEALTSADLSNLKKGDKVYFTVLGTTSSGTIDKARFRVNSNTWDTEVTSKKPGSEEFYYSYEVPDNTYSFEVNAQVHHNELDQWM